MKGRKLKAALIFILGSVIFTICFIYQWQKWQHFARKLAAMKLLEAQNRFNTNSSKIKALQKLSGIAIRNINSEWISADDICQTGVVFPSTVINSKAENYSVYFHDEKEMQTTVSYMKAHISWLRQNVNTLIRESSKFPNAFFIDIYAGLGLFSLPIVKIGLRVVAVEYRYSFAERLCRGIVAGQFKHKAFIVNNAISHVHRTTNLQSQHLSQRSSAGMDMSSNSFTRVSSINLTSLLDRFSIEEAVIKIDMTADDIRTILTSSHFFDRVKVHYVLMEWSNIARSKETPSLIEFMGRYKLVPCANPMCRFVLESSRYSTWPAYVLWVNKLLIPARSRIANMVVLQNPVRMSVQLPLAPVNQSRYN